MDWKDGNDPIIEMLTILGSKSNPRNYVFTKEKFQHSKITLWTCLLHLGEIFLFHCMVDVDLLIQ